MEAKIKMKQIDAALLQKIVDWRSQEIRGE